MISLLKLFFDLFTDNTVNFEETISSPFFLPFCLVCTIYLIRSLSPLINTSPTTPSSLPSNPILTTDSSNNVIIPEPFSFNFEEFIQNLALFLLILLLDIIFIYLTYLYGKLVTRLCLRTSRLKDRLPASNRPRILLSEPIQMNNLPVSALSRELSQRSVLEHRNSVDQQVLRQSPERFASRVNIITDLPVRSRRSASYADRRTRNRSVRNIQVLSIRVDGRIRNEYTNANNTPLLRYYPDGRIRVHQDWALAIDPVRRMQVVRAMRDIGRTLALSRSSRVLDTSTRTLALSRSSRVLDTSTRTLALSRSSRVLDTSTRTQSSVRGRRSRNNK